MEQAKNNGKLLLDTKLLNFTKPMGTKRDMKIPEISFPRWLHGLRDKGKMAPDPFLPRWQVTMCSQEKRDKIMVNPTRKGKGL